MRNLVLVTIDSLRADHCGFLGGPPSEGTPGADGGTASGIDRGALGARGSLTPTLDALAAEGTVFETAIAPGPRTPSSMPVLFTGEHVDPRNKGVYRNWEEKRERWRERRERIRRHLARHRTVAERLRERGYATAAVTANPWTATDTGFDRGFDRFHAIGDGETDSRFGRLIERTTGIDADWLLRWPDFHDRIIESRRALSEPYFLWVFLLDPHQPYLAPRRYRRENTVLEMYYANLRYNRAHSYTDVLPGHLDRRLRRAYRDTVRSVDGFVERLQTDLAPDDSVFVVHGDHGEAFREHGTYGHRPQLYEENTRVPLLVSGTERAARISEPVALRRLPRILESLADDAFDPERFTAPFVVSRTEEDERVSIRGAAWKYVRGGEDWAYVRGGEGEELYFLPADPTERRNHIAARPEAGAALRRLLDGREAARAERDRIARAAETLEPTT